MLILRAIVQGMGSVEAGMRLTDEHLEAKAGGETLSNEARPSSLFICCFMGEVARNNLHKL